MVTIRSGGGINSNKTVQSRSGYKVEPKARAMNVEAVGQQGASLAFARKRLEQGPGYTPEKQGDTGIAKATYNPATSGPGSQRTTYRSGSQSPTPPAREMAPSRDYFNERPNRSNRP